jgi:aryl-alcohol dehydrogenase-like predicted oxidoreductase
MLSRLGLGTVQFGMHYGVSNRFGQPTEVEISAILDRAHGAGIGYLDTAIVYPNSEALIGRHLPDGSDLKIITKTAPIKRDKIERGDGAAIIDDLARSLDRLRVSRVHGLLIHYADDLRAPGWEHVVEAMAEVKARGWVSRVGASVYDEGQLVLIESRFTPDLIQGPFNVLDRRLVSSACFARLKASGTEMHARSVFLQGLLLMQPAAMPAYFEPIKPAMAALQETWTQQGRSPLAACLGFVMAHPQIDAAIVGVNSLAELDEIIRLATVSSAEEALPDIGPSVDRRYLDPSAWPSFAH